MTNFKRELIESDLDGISIRRQCELIGLSRASLYYTPMQESLENLRLMKKIDKQYLSTPYYGSRRMAAWLNRMGNDVNRKRIQRLMKIMRLEAIYPRQKTSVINKEHKVYPYLLRDLEIVRPNQVWSCDITYVPMRKGFMYLMAIMDWYSRYVLSWTISNSLGIDFCLDALHSSLKKGQPEIFNSDQGSQFTSTYFTSILEGKDIKISMDGKGRAFDNIFIERLWRSYKYEDIYIKDYEDGHELIRGTNKYFKLYNEDRPHQSLNYKAPAEVYYA